MISLPDGARLVVSVRYADSSCKVCSLLAFSKFYSRALVMLSMMPSLMIEASVLKRGCCTKDLIFPNRLQVQIASSLSTTDTPPLSLILHYSAQTRPPPHALVGVGVSLLVRHGLQFRKVLSLEFCVWRIWYGLERRDARGARSE